VDFDQQCYEGRKNVYLPQYFKQNNPIIMLGIQGMTPESVRQYQNEERAALRYRIRTQRRQIKDLLDVMQEEELAPQENVISLREALAKHYQNDNFLKAKTMGAILKESLRNLFRNKK
ncbi:MAG: hypothetical protein NZ108_07885, partial [Bacteroidia bacterium]|nr:hypothetical protein [Bacteroidia bacterium]